MARLWESNRAVLPPLPRLGELVAEYGPAAFILCLPLEFTGTYLPQQLSRLVLGVVALAFLYLLLVGRRRLLIPRSAGLALLVLYVAASLVSWAVTRPPGSTSSVLDVALYPAVTLLLANLVLDEADQRRAWNAFLASALVVALLGIVVAFTHLAIWTPNRLVGARLNITFGDPNITARFLTLGACAAIVLFATRKSPPWLCAATAVTCAAVLPLTLSRSGLFVFVLAVLIAVGMAVERRRAAAMTLVAVVALGISVAADPTARQRAEDAAATVISILTGGPASLSPGAGHGQNAAADNRVYLVKAGLQMFRDHPVTGVGFGGYQHALLTGYANFLPRNLDAANLDTLSHAALVTVLAEQGVIGTALFVAFLLGLAFEAWRGRHRRDSWSPWAVIPATLMVPIFVYSQIEGRFIQEPYFWLAVGLLYSALMRQREAVAGSGAQITPGQRQKIA